MRTLYARGDAATVVRASPAPSPGSTATPPPVKQPTTNPSTAPTAQPVDPTLRCRTTTQVPHVPTVSDAAPTSRSVRLRWQYPLLDSTDCAPSTYTVAVTTTSTSAPAPPGTLTVQGQTGVEVTGLFPSTTYQVVVTAFLNGRGTASAPVQVTTGPEGPAAPTSVRSTPDGQVWTVTWTTCGGLTTTCVPATGWTVQPTICDGQGLSNPPDSLPVAGDPTQHSFSATYPAGTALLGRGLTFTVEGVGTTGQVGAPATSGCTTSWSRPVAAQLSLTASAPPVADSADGTTSTTVTLDPGTDPILDVGGAGATFTYQLLQGGSVVDTRGPTTSLTATFTHLTVGVSYSARAIVTPPHTGASGVLVGPVAVQQAQSVWPTVHASASVTDTSDTAAKLTVRLTGISQSGSRGETFDLVNSSLVCGSTSLPLTGSDLDPAKALTYTVDRLQLNGSCTVSVQLKQSSGTALSPPLYGPDSTSNAATDGPFTIDTPTLSGISASDFSADWHGSRGGSSLIRVKYTGSNSALNSADNWQVSVSDDNGATYSCGTATSGPNVDVVVDQACVDAAGGNAGAWTVRVSFDWFGAGQGPYTVSSVGSGPPDTYTAPCVVTASDFAAAWGGTTGADVATVTFTPTTSKISTCSGWTMKLTDSAGADCGSSSSTPDSATPVNITPTCSTTPGAGWNVTIGWTDTAGTSQTTPALPVTGTPP